MSTFLYKLIGIMLLFASVGVVSWQALFADLLGFGWFFGGMG